jgi:hypothetical protein
MSAPEPVRAAAWRVHGELHLSALPPHQTMQTLHLVVTAMIASYTGPDRERRRVAAALWCETLCELVAQMPVDAA